MVPDASALRAGLRAQDRRPCRGALRIAQRCGVEPAARGFARRKTFVGVCVVVVGAVGVVVVLLVVDVPPKPIPLTAPLLLNSTACSRRPAAACVALV